MSLREEIARAIHTCIANPNQRVNSDKAANATIAVLSIIEKRIDELEKWSKATPQSKIDKAIKNNELNKSHFQGCRDGFQQAIDMMKKELLK